MSSQVRFLLVVAIIAVVALAYDFKNAEPIAHRAPALQRLFVVSSATAPDEAHPAPPAEEGNLQRADPDAAVPPAPPSH